jgi:outer membrane protein assembly factor BamA
MNKSIILIVFLLIICLRSALAQDFNADDAIVKTDTIGSDKKLQIIGLPLIFYTPETELGFGVAGQMFFLRRSNVYNSRLSNAWMNLIYTTQKQIIFDFKPQLYFLKGDYFLDAAYKYKVFPNSFWGIGNTTVEEDKEQYNMTSNELRISYLKRLPPTLNFGFEYIFENHDITEVDTTLENGSPGKLVSGDIPGSQGARISGVGVIFNLDSRDNIYSPLKGNYVQFNARFSSEIIGATHNYVKYILDLRTYLTMGKRGVLALQLFLEDNYGDVPFQDQAWFGGGERGRGYFNGRFIDERMYVVQAEYRYTLSNRFKLGAFALMGEVTDVHKKYFNDIKPSFGAGIRFQVIKSNPTLIRLDYGIGKDGQSGIYFGVNEAF